MPVIRLALLLAVLGGLTLFALQNSSPVVPLVILGLQTQALPLAVWMVGAIAAGALTTLVIAALFGLSNTFASTRTRRPAAKREASRFSTSTDASWDKGWTEPQDSSYGATAASTASSANTTTGYAQSESFKPKSSFDFSNDWENVGAPIEEWEDWQDYEEPVDKPQAQVSPQASSSYSSASYNSQTYIQEPEEEREEWEDWEEESGTPSPSPAQPQQTDYEVRRDPKTSYQSGSVYSYSYREPSGSSAGKTEAVYDADYRVIIPPARSLDELDGEPSNQDSNEDDWDFDDDFEDERDRPRR